MGLANKTLLKMKIWGAHHADATALDRLVEMTCLSHAIRFDWQLRLKMTASIWKTVLILKMFPNISISTGSTKGLHVGWWVPEVTWAALWLISWHMWELTRKLVLNRKPVSPNSKVQTKAWKYGKLKAPDCLWCVLILYYFRN